MNPSAVLLPAVVWNVNWLVNLTTLTVVFENALPAWSDPPLVSSSFVPLTAAEPL